MLKYIGTVFVVMAVIHPQFVASPIDGRGICVRCGGEFGAHMFVATCPGAAADGESSLLRSRISELEDTIRLDRATADVERSHGRNVRAEAIVEGILARRGPDWAGAEVAP